MNFKFTEKNLKLVQNNLQNYPENKKKSAILYILSLAQKQNGGWLSKEVIEYIANFLSLPVLKVYEIASFYSMYNLKKIGKHHVQICTNIVCLLRGADKIMQKCQEFSVGKEKIFTITETECLGACVNAPVVQINDRYYENLNEKKIIDQLSCLNEKK